MRAFILQWDVASTRYPPHSYHNVLWKSEDALSVVTVMSDTAHNQHYMHAERNQSATVPVAHRNGALTVL